MPKRIWKTSLACSAAMVALGTANVVFAQQRTFNIPAESATDSIPEFGRQAGVQITAPDDQLARVRTPAIKGQRDARQALWELLTGTGLHVISDNGAVIVLHRGGEGASPPSETGAVVASQVSELVVTGTHIRHADPLSSVIVSTRQQIQTSGYTSIADYVQNLPQEFSGVSPQYNGLTATSNDADANDAGSTGFDLRGLGPEATLVLLNGQRTASAVGSNVFDISSLPVSLLDRLEILTDGASAVYGSDAIAGVVNIITRRDFNGFETDLDSNVESRTGHWGFDATLLGGFSWNSGNLAASYNHHSTIGLDASDRSFSSASNPNTTLLAPQDTNTAFVTFTQRILPRLVLTSDNIFSRRTGSQYNGLYDELLSNIVTKYGSINKLSYDLGRDWNVSLLGSYSQERYTDFLTYAFSSSQPFRGKAIQKSRYADLGPQIEGPLFQLPGGIARLAFGLDYQHESFDFTKSSGTTKQARDVVAVFGEALFPLVSPEQNIPGVRSLSFDLSDRWDHYSDFGGTNNPKLTGVWSPITGVEIHASYSTSFRAPDFTSLNNGNPLYVVYYDVPDPAIGGNLAPALYSYGANANLKPETATSHSFGAKISFGGDTVLTVDYFNVHYTNRIVLLINEAGTNFLEEDRFSQFVTRNPSLAQINSFISQLGSQFYNLTSPLAPPSAAVAIANLGYANAGTTDVDGLDFAGTTAFNALGGKINLRGSATYFLDYKQRIGSGGPMASLLDTKYYPTRLKGLLSADYVRGDWNLHLQTNYSSAYSDTADLACALAACPISSQFTVDAAVTVQVPRGSRGWLGGTALTVGVQNLFDVSPPFVPDQFGLGYDPSHATPLGRVISMSLRKNW